MNTEGLITPADVAAAITDQTILISIHHTNHEIGAVQPLHEIGNLARDRGVSFLRTPKLRQDELPVDVQAVSSQSAFLFSTDFTDRKASASCIKTAGRV